MEWGWEEWNQKSGWNFAKKIWRMAEKGAGMEPRVGRLGCGALGSFTENLQPLPVPGF